MEPAIDSLNNDLKIRVQISDILGNLNPVIAIILNYKQECDHVTIRFVIKTYLVQ